MAIRPAALRRSEVARLRLDDIGYRAAEVVVRGKGAREDRLPLPVDVGEAIASYLRRGRRATGRRELFLRSRAPYEPIASATVVSTVRRACRRPGSPGCAHRLRHTIACESGRAVAVAVVSNNAERAVRLYLTRHGLDDRTGPVFARTSHHPALLKPSPHLIEAVSARQEDLAFGGIAWSVSLADSHM